MLLKAKGPMSVTGGKDAIQADSFDRMGGSVHTITSWTVQGLLGRVIGLQESASLGREESGCL